MTMRTLPLARLSFLTLFLPASLGACAAGSEESEGAESATTVTPGGTGEQAGRLMVGTSKIDLASTKIFAWRQQPGVEGRELEIAPNAWTQVVAGSYCVSTRIGAVSTQPRCGVEVLANQSVIHQLGAIKVQRTGGMDDLMLGIDWPPAPGLLGSLVGTPTAVPHATGEFVYGDFPAFGGVRFSVAGGQIASINLNQTNLPAVRIYPSINRTLPNSGRPVDVFVVKDGAQCKERETPALGDFPKPLRISSATETSVALQLATCKGETVSKSWRVVLPLASTPTVVKMARIEVPKLEFEKLDGTVVEIGGTYRIQLGDRWVTSGAFGTGVDLLPSSYFENTPYTVQLEYLSPNDGAAITRTESVNLTPEW